MFYIVDPERYQDDKKRSAVVLMSFLVGPVASPMFLTVTELKAYVKQHGLNHKPAELAARVRWDRKSAARPFMTEAQASDLLEWIRVSDDPNAWKAMLAQKNPKLPLVPKRARGGQNGGGYLTEDSLMADKVLPLVGVDVKDPTSSLAEGTLGYDLLMLFESFFFWVRELRESFLPEIDIMMTGLNSMNPMIVQGISEGVAGLLSPIGVFPLSGLVFDALGQLAAYPYIAFAVYMNLSAGDLFEAARTATMFLLFVGPFVASAIKTAVHMKERLDARWEQLFDLPNRVMGPFQRVMDKLQGVSSKVMGASGKLAEVAMKAAAGSQLVGQLADKAGVQLDTLHETGLRKATGAVDGLAAKAQEHADTFLGKLPEGALRDAAAAKLNSGLANAQLKAKATLTASADKAKGLASARLNAGLGSLKSRFGAGSRTKRAFRKAGGQSRKTRRVPKRNVRRNRSRRR